MYRKLRVGGWSVSKANVLFILPNTYIEKTQRLLRDFKEIATFNFASMWEIKYGEGIDFVSLKYENGLGGFLRDNNHLFKLTRAKTGIQYISLVSEPNSGMTNNAVGQPQVVPTEETKTIMKHLFNPNNYLWADIPLHKLLTKEYFISRSAYELAFVVDAVKAQKMVIRIKQVFRTFPDGLNFNQLYRYLPNVEALKTFAIATSLSTLIDELPELFYRVRDEKLNSDIVYDGSEHTIGDLSGNDDKYFINSPTPQAIATRAINLGLYRKTLLLILRAGEARGMKINVWFSSLRLNFYTKNPSSLERAVGDLDPLTFFLALARYNLVELRSNPEIKNDIRVFLPHRYTKYKDIKRELPCLIEFNCGIEDDSTADETEESGIGRNLDGSASCEQSPRTLESPSSIQSNFETLSIKNNVSNDYNHNLISSSVL